MLIQYVRIHVSKTVCIEWDEEEREKGGERAGNLSVGSIYM